MPFEVVTTMSLSPAKADAGVVAVILVVLTNSGLVAATPPTLTDTPASAEPKLVPVMVIGVATLILLKDGVTVLMVGCEFVYRNAAVLVTSPLGTVTMISLSPEVPAGVTATILAEETCTKLVTSLPPMVTRVAPVKSDPVMVMPVPPLVGPKFGVTVLTVAEK